MSQHTYQSGRCRDICTETHETFADWPSELNATGTCHALSSIMLNRTENSTIHVLHSSGTRVALCEVCSEALPSTIPTGIQTDLGCGSCELGADFALEYGLLEPTTKSEVPFAQAQSFRVGLDGHWMPPVPLRDLEETYGRWIYDFMSLAPQAKIILPEILCIFGDGDKEILRPGLIQDHLLELSYTMSKAYKAVTGYAGIVGT